MTIAPLTDAHAMQRLGYAPASASVTGVRIDGGRAVSVDETLADETPITVAFNLSPHAVMMATPADLEDFAVGFAVTEGIVGRAADIGQISVVRYSRGVELQIDIPPTLAADVGTRSRRLSGRTGCGICGASSVDDVLRELPAVQSDARIDASAVSRAMQQLAERQPLNAETGAVHAAAWAEPDGTLAYVREDVGRHNALDKLVGALLRAGAPASIGFIVITSRGSFELVQKAAIVGVPLLATVSAPTALAVRVAHSVGLTLAGFARDDRLTAYTHLTRLLY
ncbi:MAG TPA: formate dehydrogenase accessory sulfurtransferase FdhD [Gemmatimonadaceae bacterium]